MRNEFVAALTHEAISDETILFLSGDLGFKALEPMRDAIGERFINAGVAEQNMVSVAAGLASTGWLPWTYSIAPFMVLRPLEQIRNDVCLHNLTVKLVGNGGGYGYGIMGATHHMLEDFACLAGLPNMRVHVPCFTSDVEQAVIAMLRTGGPEYLRLGQGASTQPFEPIAPFAPWRRLHTSAHPALVVVGIGPVLGNAAGALIEHSPTAVDVWCVGTMPLSELPPEFLRSVTAARGVICIEEHHAHGGLGGDLALALARAECPPKRFAHLHAAGYPSGTYGTQGFHLRESGLDPTSVRERCAELLR